MDSLKRLIWKVESMLGVKTPEGVEFTFLLRHEDLAIGTLSIKDGLWTFRYTEEFINQNEIKPLTTFSNKEKTYTSKELWPFFLSRIPGLEQPGIKKIMSEEDLSDKNEVELLKRFGKKSIQNPFLLDPVT